MFVMPSTSDNVLNTDNQQERFLGDVDNLKWYIAGFVDGEGCFSISIRRSKYAALGWTINPLFQVYQHKDNSYVLFICQKVFGCGYISKKGGNPSCFTYCVDKIADILKYVIPFFEQHPLLGEKNQNFLLFKQIVVGISRKQHLTADGFTRLARLAFRMNKMGKYRKISLEEIIGSLRKSSETIR